MNYAGLILSSSIFAKLDTISTHQYEDYRWDIVTDSLSNSAFNALGVLPTKNDCNCTGNVLSGSLPYMIPIALSSPMVFLVIWK